MTLTILALAAGTMLVMALVMSFVLGWANRAFHVEVDPRVDQTLEALPGANCGGCGYIGCGEYAEAVVAGEAINKCSVGGESCVQALAKDNYQGYISIETHMRPKIKVAREELELVRRLIEQAT